MKNTDDQIKTLEIFKRLFPFVRPYMPRLIVGTICGMLHGGATFGMLLALRWALGGLSGEGFSLSGGLPSLDSPAGNAGEMEKNILHKLLRAVPHKLLLQILRS